MIFLGVKGPLAPMSICWSQMLEKLDMLGTTCWGHPENVGDKLKMLGTN